MSVFVFKGNFHLNSFGVLDCLFMSYHIQKRRLDAALRCKSRIAWEARRIHDEQLLVVHMIQGAQLA